MDSTDIWQEGLRMGPLKVVEGGRVREDVVDLLGRNSRFSYPARGDLAAHCQAQPAAFANRLGAVERIENALM